MEKQKNVPQTGSPALRFPEFEGELKKKKLGEVAEIKRGAASQHLKYVNNENDGVRLLRINDFINNDAVYVKDTEDIKRFRVKTNDLLIAGTGATAGIIFIVPEKFNNMSFSYNAPRIRVSNAYHTFVYYYLKSEIILKEQQRLFVGNAQPFLDTDSMRGFNLNLPSLPEQTKIANFLTTIDTKIQQLTQKKALLEEYKKGVMQQLFSQKIRFKDENGGHYPDWEEKKLGDLAKSIQSGKDKADGDGDYLMYGSTGIIGKNLTYSHDGKYILIARVGANAGTLNVVKGKFSVSDNTLVFTVKEGVNIDFCYYILANQNLNKLVFGSGQPLITGGQLKAVNLSIPSLKEQTKIADFLTVIDNKIETVAKQIEQTQNYKKGLLQQLFI